MTPPRIRVATYNIHKCRGLDGQVRPDRIVKVLREVGADILALQEVWSTPGGGPAQNQAGYIARGLGLAACMGENRQVQGVGYGNLLLSRFRVRAFRNYDITQDGRERRGCLRADLDVPEGFPLHVFNVHLGTAYRERRYQGERLIGTEILNSHDLSGPRIVMGDFNEWIAGLASRLLRAHLVSVDLRPHLGSRRTYPGVMPLLHLDHIYHDRSLVVERLALHRSPTALIASDHLPLIADFLLAASADSN